MDMDILQYNRRAWNREVERGNRWTVPVSSEEIARARAGEWHIVLTPTKPVPRSWFPEPLRGADILCLASGGGQQGPILAAVGAHVTVFDNSEAQLGQDRSVAEREGLEIDTVQGDMANLSVFADESFDLIVHPVSNLFVPDIRPVWQEAFRVLRTGGALLAGIINPAMFLFEEPWESNGSLAVKYSLPYNELTDISDEQRNRYLANQEPLIFGHTLTDQLGGQLAAGFLLAELFEDSDPTHLLAKHMSTFIATRAIKGA